MKKKKTTSIIIYIIGILVSIGMIYPFIWMISSSFKSTEEILTNTLRILPQHFNIKAYLNLSMLGGVSIWRYIFNSFYITIMSIILTIIVTSMGAYVLTRKPNLPGFKLVEGFFLLSIMYPYIL